MICQACGKQISGKCLCGVCVSRKNRYLKRIKTKGFFEKRMLHWSVAALKETSELSFYQGRIKLSKLDATIKGLDAGKLHAITQLEQTVQRINDKNYKITKVWVCYKKLSIIENNKFVCKEDSADKTHKILCHRHTGKPFLLKKAHKIYMHKVG